MADLRIDPTVYDVVEWMLEQICDAEEPKPRSDAEVMDKGGGLRPVRFRGHKRNTSIDARISVDDSDSR